MYLLFEQLATNLLYLDLLITSTLQDTEYRNGWISGKASNSSLEIEEGDVFCSSSHVETP